MHNTNLLHNLLYNMFTKYHKFKTLKQLNRTIYKQLVHYITKSQILYLTYNVN